MKKSKENWIGEQCSEIEENLRKNNTKRAYQLVKDLTTVKQGKVTTVQDRSGKRLTEERQILNRWTEYRSELYNYEASGDPSVLNCPQTDTEDDHPILRREADVAVQSLKKGKSAGVDKAQEGSGEQEKMEKTGCKIICSAPTTLAVKGLMMMMMVTHTVPHITHTVPHSTHTVPHSTHTVSHSTHTIPHSTHTVPHTVRTHPRTL